MKKPPRMWRIASQLRADDVAMFMVRQRCCAPDPRSETTSACATLARRSRPKRSVFAVCTGNSRHMKATDIEEAISQLAAEPFDAVEFPFRLLASFGNKETTLRRLRSGSSNASDVKGGLLQRSNIHIAVCEAGEVSESLKKLRSSPATLKAKAKFVLATDGDMLEVEELATGEAKICKLVDLPKAFGLMLPLAGISAVRQIKDNPIDIRATNKLNKLYIELLKENSDWDCEARRADLNQFMARLIFCFFAESTGIFKGDHLFTKAIEQFTASDSSNTHEVITELFRAMDTKIEDRGKANIRPFADDFPYVNGGLFTKRNEVPKFSRIARSYLVNAGSLTWREINPDIFGSMIQAVADEDERGELGMHYTSVPNILKVLNPLFLDDLREKLEEARDNRRKLQKLRKRLARIRIFDPACGSGNFLVIAYRQMREIERRIIIRLQSGEGSDQDLLNLVSYHGERSAISLTNFYGIEIKSFAAEIARLALLIAEFQSDVNFIGQKEARDMVLPLHDTGRIKTGNALRENWLEVCPPPKAASIIEEDLGGPTGRLALDASPEPDGETYVCGNPPYLGAKKKSLYQIEDMELAGLSDAKLLDYVAAFITKALPLVRDHRYAVALVSTSSICQGEQVALLWPKVLAAAHMSFAYRPFKWANSAANNAGVWCTIVGLQADRPVSRLLFDESSVKVCAELSPYLIAGPPVICKPRSTPISKLPIMEMGSNAVDGKRLILNEQQYSDIIREDANAARFTRRYGGTKEMVAGLSRRCIWVKDNEVDAARSVRIISERLDACALYRQSAGRDARKAAGRPHAFCYSTHRDEVAVQVGNTVGNAFSYIPAALKPADLVSNHNAFTIYDVEGFELAVIVSTLHRAWAEAVSGRLGNGVRYANTVVYNTFPLPVLTDNQKRELVSCAEDILLARETHFPATIGDLYDPEKMPDNLRAAHDKNDETLERIYIGRRFKNDTERLEKLFDMYTKMTATADGGLSLKKAKRGAA